MAECEQRCLGARPPPVRAALHRSIALSERISHSVRREKPNPPVPQSTLQYRYIGTAERPFSPLCPRTVGTTCARACGRYDRLPGFTCFDVRSYAHRHRVQSVQQYPSRHGSRGLYLVRTCRSCSPTAAKELTAASAGVIALSSKYSCDARNWKQTTQMHSDRKHERLRRHDKSGADRAMPGFALWVGGYVTSVM